MSPSPSPVREGDVLAGKYRVDRVLGVGGMGIVVAATHIALDEKVALKFLLPEIAQSQEFVARFLREARAAAKIRSEHVARVSDVGTLESGAPYLVMEYLEGKDLDAHVQQGGPLPVRDAVDCVLQACEALAEAHAIGIVHRDLKPANLFLTHRADGTPSVKVLDFGISKMAVEGGSDSGLTKTSGVMGSPLYMSPEQLQSARDVDARTDVWALGVVLYELLAGRQPFSADSMPQLVMQIMTAPPLPLREVRPEVPPLLVAAIEHALQKDRKARLPDVAAFAAAVAPFGGPRATDSAERIARVLESHRMRVAAVAPPDSARQVIAATMQMTIDSAPQAIAATMQMTTGAAGTVTADGPVAYPPALPKRSYATPVAIGAAVLLLAAGGVAIATISSEPSAKRATASQPAVEPKPEEKTTPAATASATTTATAATTALATAPTTAMATARPTQPAKAAPKVAVTVTPTASTTGTKPKPPPAPTSVNIE